MSLNVDTSAFTPKYDGSLWTVGNLTQAESDVVLAAVRNWLGATEAQIRAAKTILVERVCGNRGPGFVQTFGGCPYEDYVFVRLRDTTKEEYILGTWCGGTVTVLYARFPECDVHGAPGGIMGGGEKVQHIRDVDESLLLCSLRSM